MTVPVRCYTNCYGPAGVWVAVEQVRQAGLDAIELALRPHAMGGLVIPESAVITVDTPLEQIQRFVEHLAEHNVRADAVNVGGSDLRTAEGADLVARRLRLGQAHFGATVAVTGVGQPEDDDQRRAIIDHLKSLGDLAADLGMTLALETHAGPTQNARAMRRIIEQIDRRAVRINYDTANVAFYNRDVDPCDELVAIADLIGNVHLKDSRGRFEEWYFPALGEGGAIDFLRLRKILEHAGYGRGYTIEIEGIGGEPEPTPELRHQRVVRSVEHLRSIRFFNTPL